MRVLRKYLNLFSYTLTHITCAGSLKMKVRKEGKEEAQMEAEDLRLV